MGQSPTINSIPLKFLTCGIHIYFVLCILFQSLGLNIIRRKQTPSGVELESHLKSDHIHDCHMERKETTRIRHCVIRRAHNMTASSTLALQCILKSWFWAISLRSDSHTSIYYSSLFFHLCWCVCDWLWHKYKRENGKQVRWTYGETDRETECVLKYRHIRREFSRESLACSKKAIAISINIPCALNTFWCRSL